MLLPAGLLLAGLMAGCSTAPHNVAFTLGTADRNLTYCNSQSWISTSLAPLSLAPFPSQSTSTGEV